MEMVEASQLDFGSSALESEQKSIGTQRISVSDHINAFSAEKVDSFVIDMDSFSSGTNNKDNTIANSRTTLHRSLSRKGSQRGGDKNVNSNATLQDRDTVPTTCSPKEASLLGPCKGEKSTVGSTNNNSTNPQVHHQITITASNKCNTTTESKCITRRNSFRRSSWWQLDPKRVLLIFATLSSMGTMLLIFLTLTISKQNAEDNWGDWKQ